MEFLMSYGWALLVVLLVIAALAYFGMLNPDRFLPDKITVSDNRIQLISTQANGLIIKNAGSDPLYNLQINITNHDCKISPPNTVGPGEIKRVMILCNEPAISNGRLKGDIKINYSSTTYGEIMQKTVTGTYAVRGNYFSSKGLVAYYPMDANYNDYSGSGNDLTCTGAACPSAVQGKVGNAYSFDGSDDSLYRSPASFTITGNPTKSFTIVAWFKPTTCLAADYGGISVSAGMSPRLGYVNPLYWYVQLIPSDPVASYSPCVDNQWIHLVGTYDSSSKVLTIYKNGVFIESNTVTNVDTSLTPSGINIGNAQDYFTGIIDEVMIFDRAISSSEAKALYQSTN
jgi:hypothetical protein